MIVNEKKKKFTGESPMIPVVLSISGGTHDYERLRITIRSFTNFALAETVLRHPAKKSPRFRNVAMYSRTIYNGNSQ